MTLGITPGQIKKTNRQLVYRYIYQNPRASQQDIVYALRLSRPTVAANLTALEEDGMVCRCGQIETDQIGRKAIAYAIVPDYRVAIGVEILRAMVKIVGVDLYGKKLRREVLELPFANQPEYYDRVCRGIRDFEAALGIPRERLLGVGISVQGLASTDGRTVVYGKILGCTGLKVDVFEQQLDVPCRFVHDPAAAAMSELWVSPELTDAVYLSMSSHLGGAIIAGGHIMTGIHGHNGTFEHIQARPMGELCYCGRKGCWDTLLAKRALIGERSLDEFFEAVRAGEQEAQRRWQGYLHNLARLIDTLHLVNDVDYIIGGHLAPYFTEEDIQTLYRDIREMCPFQDSDDFIRISKMPSHNITIGVSLPYIRAFLEEAGAEPVER